MSNLNFLKEQWKVRFTKPFDVVEPCPNCGCETDILSHGKSSCSECGHKEVLPCADCPRKENFTCDWNEKTRCNEFPMEINNETH